ncbi:MAG: galactosamine-6-phosphate isomerase [Maribacter sp.]|nr:galactosamine-6-phosphate isomerase [Maribacter sp.]
MNIKYCSDYNEMSQLSCDSIVSDLKKSPKQLICTATGNSTTGTYENLAKAFNNDSRLFNELIIAKLDEWVGIEPNGLGSCESYIQEKILQPLEIPQNRYISFKSNPVSPQKECERIQIEIQKKGPIDICILGLGKNGHIGFNEPTNTLTPNCHLVELTTDSLNHQMINDLNIKPTYGLTLGMADILQSKKIILLLTGLEKKEIIKELLSKQISTNLPASFLWLHNRVECYIDSNSV